MAATVTTPQLVGGGVQKPEDESFPWVLTTKWDATLLADGSPAPVTITTNIASLPWGDQSSWDNVWSDVTDAYTAIYANAPTIGPSNPISIP